MTATRNIFEGSWSRECMPHGSGQCDGYVPDDQKNAGDWCNCPCHDAQLPQTIPEVKVWHDDMFSG